MRQQNTDRPDIRARLESGFRILELIRRQRVLRNSPGLGWAVEQAILRRELEELEREWRFNPVPAGTIARRGRQQELNARRTASADP